MVSIFKSRLFRFVVRTLFDWVLLIFLFLLAGFVKNTIIAPPVCTYDPNYYKRQQIEEMKQKLDITEIRTYIDKKNNVKLFYPAFFEAVDTSGTGSASFIYKLDYRSEISLKLAVDSNILNRDVEKALNYIINRYDSSVICLDKGHDFYIVKGNSFLRKAFLINNNWIGYTLSYDADCEEDIGRLITLLKDWNPSEIR